MSERSCPLAERQEWHGRHTWTPMLAEPENPQVVHIGDVWFLCQGYRTS